MGYKPGYRADWDAAVGAVTGHGHQRQHAQLVGRPLHGPAPGARACSSPSRPFAATRPNLVDLAPTVLDLLGLAGPAHMTGRSIFRDDEPKCP